MDLNLKSNNVLPLINIKNKAADEKVATKLLNNILAPFPGLAEIPFDDSFTWDYKFKQQINTYQIYLQGMKMINIALNYFTINNNKDYIYKSKEIIEDWMEYIENGNKNNMTWYDHTVALRTSAIIKLLYFCQEENIDFDEERYYKFLNMHAEKLLEDSTHKKNNHGLMVDRALMNLGLVTQNETYFLKGYERAKSIFWITFSDKGVHLENSPEYHNMVYNMFVQLEEYLNQNDRTLGEDVVGKFGIIEAYRGVILKPDNRYPPIGDSSHTFNKHNAVMNWNDFHDSSAGISLFKSRQNSFYLAFICGYSSITHKHSDDLSFILNYNKKDFFVDPGKYKYSSDKFRQYVINKKAHNSFSINGNLVKKSNDNRFTKDVYTDHFISTKMYSMVSGYIKGNRDGLYLRRTLYYLPEENIIIGYDYGQSEKLETWNQRFNLSEQVETVDLGDDKFELINGDSRIFLKFLNQPKTEIVKANLKSKWPKAFNSPVHGKILKTKQIINRKNEEKDFYGGFIISMGNNKKVEIEDLDDCYKIFIKQNKYSLPKVN